MENDKSRYINLQRLMLKVFYFTAIFIIGYKLGAIFTETISTDGGEFRVKVLFRFLIITEIIVIGYLFFKIGKKNKPKSDDVLASIEKLGKLKDDGLITE